MEKFPAEIEANNIKNDKITYNPETHFIVDKNLLNCIICFDTTPNSYETSCCGNFICHECKGFLKDSKCPICKINTELNISKISKRIISNSISKCPLCPFTDIYDRIAKHFLKSHLDYIKKIEKIEKDKILFNFLSTYFCISFEKKFFIHDHPLQLTTKEENNCVCFAGCVLRFKNCKMLDSIDNNEQKAKTDSIESKIDSNQNILDEKLENLNLKDLVSQKNSCEKENLIINSEIVDKNILVQSSNKILDKNNYDNLNESDELKKLLMQRLIYFCSECEGYFCDNCLEGKDIWIRVKVHDHLLNLTKKSTPWTCDGKLFSEGCFNQNKPTSGLARYRCNECDFDLCEKCLMFYIDENQI